MLIFSCRRPFVVPIDTTAIRCIYVFVEISVDTKHLLDTVKLNFPACLATSSTAASRTSNKGKAPAREPGDPAVTIGDDVAVLETKSGSKTWEEDEQAQDCHLAVVGTVQFLAAVHGLKPELEKQSGLGNFPLTQLALTDGIIDAPVSRSRCPKYRITIPQVKPLSPGEVLGCTAPRLPADVDALLYIGDGRFHLESIMIANPSLPAYRYDPYSKRLTQEMYDHNEMRRMRADSIMQARRSLQLPGERACNGNWAVILGTLGRQGSLSVLKSLTTHLPLGSTIPLLLSELSPSKLTLLSDISVFVQTSCPRLSIDWGYAFTQPLLSPYEAQVALGRAESKWMTKDVKEEYPMDFYADESRGEWTPRWQIGQRDRERKEKRANRERERQREGPPMLAAAA